MIGSRPFLDLFVHRFYVS